MDVALFPVRHSILDAPALGRELARRYGWSGAVHCHLFHKGMNDVFQVRAEGRHYAVRVWRANWRTIDNVIYETEFLRFLDSAGIPVAPPLAARDGTDYFTVQTVEGIRPVAVFEWAEGRPFGASPEEQAALRLGQLFARMHLVAPGFSPSIPRLTNPVREIERNLPALLDLLGDKPDQQALFTDAVQRVVAAVEAIDPTLVPRGPTHGDFHFNNCHVDADGRITLLDFDNAGEDFYVQDVACYLWANEYGGYDRVYADAFVAGYEQERPFSQAERAVMPLLILAKELRLITGFAHHVNAIGFFPLRFRSLDWFHTSVRHHLTLAGL